MNKPIFLGVSLLAAALLAGGASLQPLSASAVVAQSIDSDDYLPPSFDIGTMPPQPAQGGIDRPVERLASGR